MRPLLTLSARWVLISCSLILTVAALGGLVRLLPWLFAKDVPFAISVPFAELLSIRGVEIAVLVGVPMGTAIAAALFVERGESRALAALGAAPLRVTASLLPFGLALVLISGAIARTVPLDDPARLVARLVNAGRLACAASTKPRRVDVPLLSSSWLCFTDGPRLVGRVPGLRSELWFSSRGLDIAGESPVVLDELRLAGAAPPLHVALAARQARISGIAGWGHARRLGGLARGLFVGVVGLGTAWASAWAILRGGLAAPIWAAAASGASALAAVAAIRAFDAGHAGAATYALVLPLDAALVLLLHGIAARVLRWRIAGRKA